MGITDNSPAEYEETLNQCAMYNLRRLSRLTTNSLNQVLIPTGLRCTQYAIMLAAGARPGSTMTVLSDYLGMDISTLTRSLESLAQQGFITFKSGKQREKLAYLSDQGAKKIEISQPIWEAEQQRFIEAFGVDSWNACIAAIHLFNDDLQNAAE